MTNNGDMPDIPIETMAETENYTIWSAAELDGETTYHLELGPVTVHFFTEEWNEFLEMIREAAQAASGEKGDVEIELDWGALWFDEDEWAEFMQLVAQVSS